MGEALIPNLGNERRLARQNCTDWIKDKTWSAPRNVDRGQVLGLIDWKEAGVGHPGVDLAYLRFSAVVHHGPDGPALVLEGWEDEMGRKASELAYWDSRVAARAGG